MIIQYVALKKMSEDAFKQLVSKHASRELNYRQLRIYFDSSPSIFEFDVTRAAEPLEIPDESVMYSALSRLQRLMKENKTAEPAGFLCYPYLSSIEQSDRADIYWVDPLVDYKIRSQLIENPLRTYNESFRKVVHNHVDEKANMFDQFLHVINRRHLLHAVLVKASLPVFDFQVNQIYSLQLTALPTHTNMGAQEAVSLMRNILRVQGLEVPHVRILKSSNTCSFTMKISVTKPEDNLLINDVFADPRLDTVDYTLRKPQLSDTEIELLERQRVLTMDDLEFEFNLAQGLNAAVLIHEIAHYIASIIPTKYRFNEGLEPLTKLYYTVLFASHGVLYSTVFLYLLRVTKIYDASKIEAEMRALDIEYESIEDLTVEAVDDAIVRHMKRFNESPKAQDLMSQYLEIAEKNATALKPFF